MKNFEDPSNPFEQGYNAYINKCTKSDCPYIEASADNKEWVSGWVQAKSEHDFRKELNQFVDGRS